jgi:hypothetical protein
MPFRRLLYRFLFFDWLFRDVSAARDRIERHAAHQHNRKMSRYLPVYLRRWSFLTAFDFALGILFEKVLQAGLLSAWFFTWSCVTLTGHGRHHGGLGDPDARPPLLDVRHTSTTVFLRFQLNSEPAGP